MDESWRERYTCTCVHLHAFSHNNSPVLVWMLKRSCFRLRAVVPQKFLSEFERLDVLRTQKVQYRFAQTQAT